MVRAIVRQCGIGFRIRCGLHSSSLLVRPRSSLFPHCAFHGFTPFFLFSFSSSRSRVPRLGLNYSQATALRLSEELRRYNYLDTVLRPSGGSCLMLFIATARVNMLGSRD